MVSYIPVSSRSDIFDWFLSFLSFLFPPPSFPRLPSCTANELQFDFYSNSISYSLRFLKEKENQTADDDDAVAVNDGRDVKMKSNSNLFKQSKHTFTY